jgi:SH3-like domain-containing protein
MQPVAARRTDLNTEKLALPSFVVLYPLKVPVKTGSAFQYKTRYVFEKSNLVWILAS